MTGAARGRRRSQGIDGKLLVLALIAAIAMLAPGLLEQTATALATILSSLLLLAGELLAQVVMQPLLDSVQEAVSTEHLPAPTTSP